MKRIEIINEVHRIVNDSDDIEVIREEMSKFLASITPKVAEAKNETKVFLINKKTKFPENVKVSPQMSICRDILLEVKGDEITFDEARDLFRQKVDLLKTKQDGFRIFQYYRKNLEDLGIIKTEVRSA